MDEGGERLRFRATWIAAALIVAMWLAGIVAGVDPWAPDPDDLVAIGGNLASRTRDGQWWRLVTAALVHAGAVLLVVNVALLVVLGTVLERRTGRGGVVVVLLGSTLVASAASLAWAPYAVSVGASGAVSGVCGALVVALLRARDTFTPRARAITAAAVIACVAWGVLLAALVDGVDHAAHGAGLVTGAALGLAVIRPREAVPGTASGRGTVPGTTSGLGLIAAAGLAALIVATSPAIRDVRADARRMLAIDARFDAIVSGAGRRPDRAALAEQLEVEVLAPLRELSDAALVDPRMPARERERADAIRTYAMARLRALELFVRYLETDDPALQAQIEEASAAAAAALERTR